MPHNNPDLADIIHAAIEEAAKLRAYDPKHELLRYIGSADKTDVWEAFLDYRMNATFLTGLDTGVIQRLTANAAKNRTSPPFSEEEFLAAQDPAWATLARSRERDECRSKLAMLGLLAPAN